MAQVLDFYYDFGSPNAYFAWRALQGVTQRTGLEVVMQPVLIGGVFKLTGNSPPWMAFGKVPQKMAYMRLEIERFVKMNGLNAFKMNSAFPVNTLLSMRGAIAAQNQGVHSLYVETVFKAIWEQDLDISQTTVLKRVMDTAGLPSKNILAESETEAVKDGLKVATQACVNRGVFGLPALFLGDEMYFGKETVVQIEQAVLEGSSTCL